VAARLTPAPEPTEREFFGERLRRLRVARGMTQQAVAERCGCSHIAISHWERIAAIPNSKFLPALARTLGVSIDQLVTGRESPQLAALHRAILVGTPVERLRGMVRGGE